MNKMNNKYKYFRFQEISVEEGAVYTGQITHWMIAEDKVQGDRLRVFVDIEGIEFLYSCKISKLVNSPFFFFCKEMELLCEDGRIDFSVLDYDGYVDVTLAQLPDGRYLIASMSWSEEGVDDDE